MSKDSRTRRSTKIAALIATVAALSVVGPVASAQAGNPTDAQYGTEVGKVAAGFGGSDPAPPASGLEKEVVSGLPFTGLDVVALAAIAIALTSMGLALRRLTAERHSV
jgi:hypothetical protein